MATKFPIETDKPIIEVTLPVGRHVLELVVEDSAGLRSAPDTVVITVQKAEVVAVSVSPVTASLNTGKQQQFTATVTGITNKAVTWSVQEAGGGTVTTAGLYTAPATGGTYHVRATSVADPTRNASATVTVTAVSCVAGSPGVPCTGAAPLSCVAGAPNTPCSGAAPTVNCVAGAPNTSCSGAAPTILCTTGSPTLLCTGGSPTILCTTGSPSVACTAATPTITCAAGAPGTVLECTAAAPQVLSCTGGSPQVLSCTGGSPQVLNCTGGAPQVLNCTGASPSIVIRSEQDADAGKEVSKEPEKPEVKPKSKPKKK